jgi:hypothetical protein
MSTSPPCSFFDADASAASTAPNTTSRSTLFSREMASPASTVRGSLFSTSNHSIGAGSRPPVACEAAQSPPLEIDHRHEPGFTHFVQQEIEGLLALASSKTTASRRRPRRGSSSR